MVRGESRGGEEKKAREKSDAWGSCVYCSSWGLACCPCLRLFLAAGGSETTKFELCGAPRGRTKKGPEEPPKSERQGPNRHEKEGGRTKEKAAALHAGDPPDPPKIVFFPLRPPSNGAVLCLLASGKQASKQTKHRPRSFPAPPPPSLPPRFLLSPQLLGGRALQTGLIL